MYDGGKVIVGLGIFVAVATFPIWFAAASGPAGPVPEPKLPDGGGSCIESTQFMRDSHMELLNEWRDSVVRDNKREYVAQDGQRWEMSLSRTCMSCHTSRTEFCTACHTKLGVEPTCWSCHVQPEGR